MKLARKRGNYFKTIKYQCINTLVLLMVPVLLLVFPQSILATEVINITNFPSNKIAGEEFEVNFDASGLATSSQYYMKGLGGDIGSSLTEIDTWNNGWIQQNGSWPSMPTFSSNPEGSASATLKVRFDPNVESNSKEFKLRIRKTDGSTNIDSSLVTISVTAATPAPTQAPTNPPTAIPTKSPSPTLAPATKPIPTKTTTPKLTPTEESWADTEDISTSLNDVKSPSPEPKVAGVSTTNNKPLVAIVLVSLGLLSLGYCGYLLYNQKHGKHQEIN